MQVQTLEELRGKVPEIASENDETEKREREREKKRQREKREKGYPEGLQIFHFFLPILVGLREEKG